MAERLLLVFADKEFQIAIPHEAKVTFGPWSPPTNKGYEGRHPTGTLRVYANHKTGADCIFVQSGVTHFRDVYSVSYREAVLKEEGSTIWKSDERGYIREEKASGRREWHTPELPPVSDENENDQW